MNFKYFFLSLFFAGIFNGVFYYIDKKNAINNINTYTCKIGQILYVDYSHKYPYDMFIKRFTKKDYSHVEICGYNQKFMSISSDYLGAKPHLDIDNGDYKKYPHKIITPKVNKLCIITQSYNLANLLNNHKISYNWSLKPKKNSYNCKQFIFKIINQCKN